MSGVWKKFGTGLGALLGLVVVGGGGVYAWAGSAADAYFARTYDAPAHDIPIPFPLSEAEIAALRAERTASTPPEGAPPTDGTLRPADGAPPVDALAGVDLDAIATERAIARGKHLVGARYGCVECHGADFGGGTMIDDPAMGTILGKNMTSGKGSAVAAYTAADWDRKVRHGIAPSGRSGPMPSRDYVNMSDRELSDIVAYIRSVPPVDRVVPEPTLGPVGRVLVATGTLKSAADEIGAQRMEHPLDPPAAEVSVAFGAHLLHVCTGCHRPNLEGGPIAGGPPDWLPASNLTPGPEGLAGWTEADFVKVMREGLKRDGSPVGAPMSMMNKYGQAMTDTELSAMWVALQATPPVPDGG
jgi:mono/diheme cytochrome c family protein